MPDFKKTIATVKKKVAMAEARAFIARMEALDAVLEGANPDDIMQLAAHALAEVAPDCCERHLEEFQAGFLQMVDGFIAVAREDEVQDATGDASRQVH
jgi:hypothetical protein